MSEQTDGELFWKITQGRTPMPAYRGTLSQKQRWAMVNYLRTLADQTAPATTRGEPPQTPEPQAPSKPRVTAAPKPGDERNKAGETCARQPFALPLPGKAQIESLTARAACSFDRASKIEAALWCFYSSLIPGSVLLALLAT